MAEIVLTAFLVFTVLAATDRIASVAFAGIPIGLVLTLIHLVGIPITNTVGQPGAQHRARRCSSAAGRSSSCGCSSSAPLAGALLGAILHRALFAGGAPIEPEESAVEADPSAARPAAA